MSQAKRWCFTLNNPTADEQFNLALHGESITADPDASHFSYLVFGRETGESGTYHLQGYFNLSTKKRLGFIKSLPGFGRCHLEVARGTHAQSSTYCKKDGDFDEYGSPPSSTGSGAQFEQLRDWVAAQDPAPTFKDVWETFPTLAARYKSAVLDCIAFFGKRPGLVDGPLRPWQQNINNIVSNEADDRKVVFVVDENGNSGKSWLTRYWISSRCGTQFLSVGKRDDLAYSVDIESDLFVFDIPRGSMEYVQYGVFEQLKNRVIYSPKYNSQTKVLKSTPHVVVFCNEEPDRTKMTHDRYHVINLRNLN